MGRERHGTSGLTWECWEHCGTPGLLAVALSPLLGKLGGDPKPFHQTLKLEAAKAPVAGEADSLAEAAVLMEQAGCGFSQCPGHGSGRKVPILHSGSSGGHLSPAFVPLSLHHPQPCCSQGCSGAAPWEAPKRDLLFWPLLSPEVTPSPFRAGWLIPRGSACWELGELRIWTGKVLAFNSLSGLF